MSESSFSKNALIPDYGASLPKQYRPASVGEIPDLKIPRLFRMLVLGPSGAGKNNLVHYIIKHSPNVFAHLHVIARNPNQPLYDFLRDKLDGFVTFHNDPINVDQVRRTPLSSNHPELVVIDDWSNDKLLQEKVFAHYFTRGRHFKLSTIFLTHSYFSTAKMIRLNSDLLAILRANSKRDLRMIVRDFNIQGLTDEVMYKCYAQATKHHGQILFVDQLKSQLRFNFDKPVLIENNRIEEE